MAINKKLIHFKSKQKFNEELANGNILETSIVFISDTLEIYTHGTFYDGSKVDLSKLEEAISKIKTDGDGLMYLNDKGEYEIPLIIVDSEEELNSITPEIGTRAIVRTVVEGYDNLNLAKIINGEETNVPADMFDAPDKYAFKVTSVDTSILFPYLEGEEHTVYELFTLGDLEEFEIVTNLDGSSIARVYIDNFGSPIFIYSSSGLEFYWHDNNIVERIITIDNIMGIMNLGQNVVDAFLLFSTALNVSIITNRDYTDYYYTSKGWVLSDYITTQLFLIFLSSFLEQIPTRVSQLVNDSNYITKTEVADSYLPIGDYATKAEIPTKVSELENDANYILDDVISDGVYAVNANGKLIDYNTADVTALGVALVAGEHKFMIAKSDATDGTNTTLYWGKNLYQKDVAGITNISSSADYIGEGKKYGTDFTTWSTGPVVDFNGAANTAAIIAGYTEHGVSMEARDMCTVLNTFNASDSYNDWYVPACGQLALMYLAKTDINAALAKIGGTAFESNDYWSSSEYVANSAWYVDFDDGYVDSRSKHGGNRVRFVRDISVKPLKERVDDLESSKQDTLISGTNIKTINGTSILGSGNIVIKGGSSSGGGGAYAEVNHGTSDTTFALTPNTFHVWDEVASLDLSFADETAGVANEYLFQFTSGARATTLTLPDVKWANDTAPTIAENMIYQISVLKGLASVLEFDNKPKVVTISFKIRNFDCLAEEGMTWEQWVSSEYNTINCAFVGNNVHRSGEMVGTSDTVFVTKTDAIISDFAYKLIQMT